jgi:hypothetical protein
MVRFRLRLKYYVFDEPGCVKVRNRWFGSYVFNRKESDRDSGKLYGLISEG